MSTKHSQIGAATATDFMLTFPIFAFLLLFMIQMGLVLHAYTVIQYSAYKAARAARVHILDGDHAFLAMEVSAFVEAAKSIPNGLVIAEGLFGSDISGINSEALEHIRASAMNQLVSISPSSYRYATGSQNSSWDEEYFRQYVSEASKVYRDRVEPLVRKARYAYSDANTQVDFKFIDLMNLDLQDIEDIAHVFSTIKETPIYSLVNLPVTITVRHRYELQIPIGQLFFANDKQRSFGRWMEATVRLM